jgi:predicted unusual protein kinase regulating ubiquinone biosynthesis (AarF/ABC1/UbiB family)
VIQTYIFDIFLSRFVLTRWYVRRTAMKRWVIVARRYRKMAVELGGMHIKFGQFLSSRADIIPDPVRYELFGLQDEVPAAPVSHVLDLIMAEHGKSPDEVFQYFDRECVAAASLGQVHYAVLHDGREVAVKVQRPHIEEILEVDLRALEWILYIIKDYPAVRRRADVMALYKEFSVVLLQELDYIQEAQNALILRSNFEGIPGIYFPLSMTEMTTRRVLVMERINGIKISDREAIEAAGINRLELANRLNQSYLKQFFLDGFFHADPHPGNLFVRPEEDDSLARDFTLFGRTDVQKAVQPSTNGVTPASYGTPFTLIFVDFGMVGQISQETMEVVRDGVLGLATNDAERVVDALFKLNMFLPHTDRQNVIKMMEVMLKHTYNRSVREWNNMDVEQIFNETHDLVYDLPFQIPKDLLYLGRAVSMVSGLATEIEPEINLFESLRPFARKMLDLENQNGDLFGRLQKEITELGQILITLPRQMDAYYKSANRGELQTRPDFVRVERMLRRVERSNDRLAAGVLATGLFLGGVQLRMRGMDKESRQAWAVAAAAIIWSNWPRGNGS